MTNSPLTLEKSKSFRSIDGDGRTFSGPLSDWFMNCWLWLLLPKPLMLALSLWWFDFSLNDIGDGDTFEFELAFKFDKFNSSVLLCCSLFELLWTGVFEFGRECGASAMGLRRLSFCLTELVGEPASSFFGVLGRVKANACVCKKTWKKIEMKLLTSLTAHKTNWTWCTWKWFLPWKRMSVVKWRLIYVDLNMKRNNRDKESKSFHWKMHTQHTEPARRRGFIEFMASPFQCFNWVIYENFISL